MDIEIVLDGTRVVGASTKKQGAEVIRIEEAQRMAKNPWAFVEVERLKRPDEREFYDRMTITNTELQDVDE